MIDAPVIVKLPYLNVTFDIEITQDEIGKFRGAVAQIAGEELVLFHNHLPENKLRNSYSLVQYYRKGKKASILCIKEGIDEFSAFLQKNVREVRIGERKAFLEIDKLYTGNYTMQVWDKLWTYKTINWIALNQTRYQEYRNMEEDESKKELLKEVLIGNILSMAKGINWHIDKHISIEILSFKRSGSAYFKDVQLAKFDVVFRSNVFLPDYLGLGKAVSFGYGRVRQIK